jgi:hypothetical protein
MNMFSNHLRAQGKHEESEMFMDSYHRNKSSKKKSKRVVKRNLSVKTNLKQGNYFSLRNPTSYDKNRSASKKKLKSFTIRKNKSRSKKKKAKSSKPLKVKTSKLKFSTPKNYKMDISPFNLKYKKINFSKNNILTNASEMCEAEMAKNNKNYDQEFEYLVANSFKNSKKIKTIDRLENIMNGKLCEKLDMQSLNTSSPVLLNCDLKKMLNFYQEKLKALKTKAIYIEKHNGKLSKIFEK